MIVESQNCFWKDLVRMLWNSLLDFLKGKKEKALVEVE